MYIRSELSSFHLREFNRNVRLFFLYGISINAGMALFTLLYNLYLLRLSYQEDFIGQVAGMAPLATGLLALPIGMLSDRFGRKPFLVASSLLLAVSQLGMCLATTPTALLLFSFLGGVATACIWVNHVPFLSDNASPWRRAEALALWSAVQVVVRMFWSLAGGFLPGFVGNVLDTSTDMPEPFRYALFLGAVFSLIAALPLLRMPGHAGRDTHVEDVNEEPEAASTSPWPTFLGIAALSGSRGFSVGADLSLFQRLLRGGAAHRRHGDWRDLLPQSAGEPAGDLHRAGAGAQIRCDDDDSAGPHGWRHRPRCHGDLHQSAGGASDVSVDARR